MLALLMPLLGGLLGQRVMLPSSSWAWESSGGEVQLSWGCCISPQLLEDEMGQRQGKRASPPPAHPASPRVLSECKVSPKSSGQEKEITLEK